MTGKQLKNSILQWAIQGKLVPQDPNDEPASVLLEKIREEKAKLVKEGKIKKDKNESIIFRGDDNSHYEKFIATGEVKCIDDEIPFEIPDGWEWCRMGSIGDWGAGATPAKGNLSYYGGNILWLRTGELNNDIVYDTEIKITDKALKECSLRLNKEGDVLIAMYGATIGKVAIAGCELTTNQACCACTPLGIFNYYLFYFLMGSQLDFIKKGEGGAQPNISREKLISHLMPIPPLQEQHRIVKRTQELLPLINRYASSQMALDKLNKEVSGKLKKSILQEAIQGRLVPQNPEDEPASKLLERIREEKQKLLKEGKLKKKDITDSVIFRGDDNAHYEKVGNSITCIDDEIPFDIPENWAWVRMGVLIKLIGGTSYQKKDIQTSGIRIIRGGNIQDNRLLLCDDDVFVPICYQDAEKNIQVGDTIIVASTGSQMTIGKPAVISKYVDNTQIGAFLRIARPLFSDLSLYVQMLYTTEYYREHIRSRAKGTNINNIKSEYIEQLLVPLPPVAEQQRIVQRINELSMKLK